MRARTRALPANEIAIRGAGTALAGRHLIGVHAQAHGTARLAPFEAGINEDAVQPFGFGLALHKAGTRYHQRLPHVAGHLAAAHHIGSHAQILDAAVGAAADEDILYGHIFHAGTGGEAHIIQALLRCCALAGIGEAGRIGHHIGDGDHVIRAGTPGDERGNGAAVDGDALVIRRARIGFQRLPPGQRCLPCCTLGRTRAAFNIGEGLFIRRDQAGAGAGFNRHVAQRHPPFHGERLDHRAGIFDDMPGTAARTQHAAHGQRDILGGDGEAELARHMHLQRFGLTQQQRLRCKNMLHFRGADTKGQRAERTMGGGVAVPTDHSDTRQGKALFRADDVDDALFRRIDIVELHPEIGAVLHQRVELCLRHRIEDRQPAIRGRNVVIGHGQRKIRPAQPAASNAQRLKRLRGGHFVDEVTIDEDQRGAVIKRLDDMIVPDLLVEGAGGAAHGMRLCQGRAPKSSGK